MKTASIFFSNRNEEVCDNVRVLLSEFELSENEY